MSRTGNGVLQKLQSMLASFDVSPDRCCAVFLITWPTWVPRPVQKTERQRQVSQHMSPEIIGLITQYSARLRINPVHLERVRVIYSRN